MPSRPPEAPDWALTLQEELRAEEAREGSESQEGARGHGVGTLRQWPEQGREGGSTSRDGWERCRRPSEADLNRGLARLGGCQCPREAVASL